MIDDDDDLPVLTDVLRAGTVRDAAAIDERSTAASPPEAGPAEMPLLADPLVIGDEPRHEISAYLAPTTPVATEVDVGPDHRVDAPSADDDEAPVHHGPDAFLLPQDQDGPSTARPSTLDVPELGASTPPVVRETPAAAAAAEDPAALARRIRDTVVEDLRARIDTEFDARIAQALHAEVEVVVALLQQNLRTHLSDALRDVVAKAVDEAIARRADAPPSAA